MITFIGIMFILAQCFCASVFINSHSLHCIHSELQTSPKWLNWAPDIIFQIIQMATYIQFLTADQFVMK